MMKLPSAGVAMVAASLALTGCISISPDSLKTPSQISCFDLPSTTQAHEKVGVLHVPWLYTVAPGPYLSEWEDTLGVYYRGPQRSILITPDKGDDPTKNNYRSYEDGGIWIPHDAAQSPHLYTYIGTSSKEPGVSIVGASCANAVLLPPPTPDGVNTVAFAVAGAAGGAAGGVAGRALVSSSSMSYRQAAGVGLAAGAISGLIVGKLIDMENGRIRNWAPLADPDALKTLQEAAKTVTAVTLQTPAKAEKGN